MVELAGWGSVINGANFDNNIKTGDFSLKDILKSTLHDRWKIKNIKKMVFGHEKSLNIKKKYLNVIIKKIQ